jgi:membrane associated rhomboid family serine protease
MSITLLIMILTAVTSIMAFNNPAMKGQALFYPYAIQARNEWYRFLTSGFIHADWLHLIVNMYVLYIFGKLLEDYFLPAYFVEKGRLVYLLLYIGGMVAADLPSYFKHRNNAMFRSLGASGAVSAIVFASIVINPWQGGIGLLFLPITLPPIIFGVLYLIYTVYMSQRQSDNINHDAHLFGAVFGLVIPCLLDFRIFQSFIDQLSSRL